MNEDVFPIGKGEFLAAMLVYWRVSMLVHVLSKYITILFLSLEVSTMWDLQSRDASESLVPMKKSRSDRFTGQVNFIPPKYSKLRFGLIF